jgi:uncharacterized protein (DUF58 family)
LSVGVAVGAPLGVAVGAAVGPGVAVGTPVAVAVGAALGVAVGAELGVAVAAVLGVAVGAAVADPSGRARLKPFVPLPADTPGESPVNVYSGAPSYASCFSPLSLRVKDDQGAESTTPAGGGTDGHAARHPPAQFDVSVVSPSNV